MYLICYTLLLVSLSIENVALLNALLERSRIPAWVVVSMELQRKRLIFHYNKTNKDCLKQHYLK